MGLCCRGATVDTVFGTINVSGTQGDGVITLVLGGVLALLAILDLVGQNVSKWLYVALGAAAVGVAVFDVVNLSRRIGEITSELVRPSVGMGLMIVVGGGIVACVAGLVRD